MFGWEVYNLVSDVYKWWKEVGSEVGVAAPRELGPLCVSPLHSTTATGINHGEDLARNILAV